jgi:hypothetical protein
MQLKALVLAVLVAVAPLGGAWAEGAIAVDDQAGSKPGDAGYGIGFGDSKEAAQAAALKQCKAAGNDACTVAVWFKKCGAYASSHEKYGIGWGGSEDIAKSRALDSCGNANCRIVASECED